MVKTKLSIINNKKLETPAFIPSLTSIKNFLNYFEIFDILTHQNNLPFLISAFDLYYLNLIDEKQLILKDFEKNKNLFFLDSGAFELFNGFQNRNWNNDLLFQVANTIYPDIIISLDTIVHDTYDKIDIDLQYFEELKQEFMDKTQFYEVVIQSTKIDEIKNFLNKLEIDKKLLAFCIPERNLGFSFQTKLEKLNSIIKIIKEDFDYNEILIHLLGCSEPKSIIKYSKIGVDLFDGIHWYDTIFEPNVNELIDISRLLEIECDCSHCIKLSEKLKISKVNIEEIYIYYALNHNLENYRNLMINIREEE